MGGFEGFGGVWGGLFSALRVQGFFGSFLGFVGGFWGVLEGLKSIFVVCVGVEGFIEDGCTFVQGKRFVHVWDG